MKYSHEQAKNNLLKDLLKIYSDKKLYLNEKSYLIRLCKELYLLDYYRNFESYIDCELAYEFVDSCGKIDT